MRLALFCGRVGSFGLAAFVGGLGFCFTTVVVGFTTVVVGFTTVVGGFATVVVGFAFPFGRFEVRRLNRGGIFNLGGGNHGSVLNLGCGHRRGLFGFRRGHRFFFCRLFAASQSYDQEPGENRAPYTSDCAVDHV